MKNFSFTKQRNGARDRVVIPDEQSSLSKTQRGEVPEIISLESNQLDKVEHGKMTRPEHCLGKTESDSIQAEDAIHS